MKIVSTGRTISTSEYLEKKHRARRKRVMLASGALLGLLVIIIVVLRLQSLQITEVVAEGVPATGSAKVEDAARSFLGSSYLWLVPKTNALFYPKSSLEASLRREFPRLSLVAVSLEGAHMLRIEGAERKPFALYCAGTCYFLDEGGFVFDTAPSFSDGVYFTYTSDPALESPLGKQFVPEAEFEAVTAFVTNVRKLGVEPRSLLLTPAEGTLFLATGTTIRFSRASDMPTLSDSLASFLASEDIKQEKDFWQRLSALDMRTENKVFYTFRAE